MRSVKLFIATSLDGYIAGPNDEIDWLFTDGDYGYKKFYDSIDTTLSGYNTYRLALTFGSFPYPDKTNYVFSRLHQHHEDTPVTFISADPCQLVSDLRKKDGKDIWLVGGGQLNTLLLNAGLIDEMIISVHPIILGNGIPLFGGHPKQLKLKLLASEAFSSGLLQVTYKTAE
jgi:dihydrofolate reductase